MAGDDLKQYATSREDYYGLLGIEVTASEGEIRKAYRTTARRYHPDKVGADNVAAIEKFHQLQIAYDVLTDPAAKDIYDSARRAREQQQARQAAFDGRRKAMIDELEAREGGGLKRKHDGEDEEARLEQELRRLAAEGKRRREELATKRQAEYEAAEAAARKANEGKQASAISTMRTDQSVINDQERCVMFRFKKDAATAHLDETVLRALFAGYGEIQTVLLQNKRRKPPGEKHKVDYCVGMIEFANASAARIAALEVSKNRVRDADAAQLEAVYLRGQDPDASKNERKPGLERSADVHGGRDAQSDQKGPSSTFVAPASTSGADMSLWERIQAFEKRQREAGQQAAGNPD